ncbi:unnamed protein product [Nesidiocoris tenuis]|uniref:Reverse transcriptase domain-containing protein n=1 Tax=Nesidiocoris tenuis TaxID=355587 RepID=A0A6H5HS73_9HEMI|nr:unnamed protein product [Nesidiocoris tenuis]
MASTNLSTSVSGVVVLDLELQGFRYTNFKLSVLPSLCSDILIGHDIMQKHTRVDLNFGGNQPPLSITAVTQAAVEPVRLFTNLDPDIRPIATKSKKHSPEDLTFIKTEVKQLLDDGIIEESISPWRAQVLVVRSDTRKRRMVINYAQTINKFTVLDAYPVPNIDEMVSEIAKYSVFSTLDLKSAYHQVPIHRDDRPYTAFEADGNLYQFKMYVADMLSRAFLKEEGENDDVDMSQMVHALTYGEPTTLPVDSLENSNHLETVSSFIENLCSQLREMRPVPFKHHSTKKVYFHKDLRTSSHVFVRRDAVRRPLQPTYDDPYRVVSRSDKTFSIIMPHGEQTVTVDRLKPAYLLSSDPPDSSSKPSIPTSQPTPINRLSDSTSGRDPQPPASPASPDRRAVTRTGRHVRCPARFVSSSHRIYWKGSTVEVASEVTPSNCP